VGFADYFSGVGVEAAGADGFGSAVDADDYVDC